MDNRDPKWLEWGKRLLAIAQNGLTYARDYYDVERYEMIRRIAAEILSSAADLPAKPVLYLFKGDVGYATPKVDVRGALFRDDTILMVQERADGLWSLPGGWADVNETPREAIEREIVEESGLEARATKLLAIYDRARHAHQPPSPMYVYKLFFLCQETGGEPTTSYETPAVGFFRLAELPELSLGRVTRWQVERMFQLRETPDAPTEFD